MKVAISRVRQTQNKHGVLLKISTTYNKGYFQFEPFPRSFDIPC